jgi:hypothetical protein
VGVTEKEEYHLTSLMAQLEGLTIRVCEGEI